MRLVDLVDVWIALRETRSRTEKRDIVAGLLRDAPAAELPTLVSYLCGSLPQGSIGVGHATVGGIATPPAQAAELTIADVDTTLDAVAATTGPGSKAAREQLLIDLFSRAGKPEQEFLRRLLVGELRQGALEGILTDAIAAATGAPIGDVRRAVMLNGDLAAVAAAALEDGSEALQRFRIRLFRPLQPMLAQTAASVGEALAATGSASIEVKVDGARVQVHRFADRISVYTRNLRDVTNRSPDVVAAAKMLDVESVILDGEAVAMRADGRPHPFQVTMSRFGSGEQAAVVPLFFDCLHLNGVDLIDEPGATRFEALAQVIPSDMLIPRIVTDDAAEADRFYEDAVSAGHEGVMVKAVQAPYEAGRRGARWQKVKPVHTLDLVVVAVEWGSGRRRGWLSNLHLGARDPSTGTFVMLGKTFKGLTDEMLEWQTKRLLELETRREGHVVHVRPEQVVEIAFDGVQASSRYPGGVALRFARVKEYRMDKAAGEADTIDAVRSIFERGRT